MSDPAAVERRWPVTGGRGSKCFYCERDATHTWSAGSDEWPYSMHGCDEHTPRGARHE